MNARFLAVANDPRIIPAVHHHCDEWCDYCPVTNRCLVFRCEAELRKQRGRRASEPTHANMDEVIAFTREMAAIEGMPTDELDALLAHPPGESGIETSDPLVSTAWEYAVRVAIIMMPAALAIATAMPRLPHPEPEAVVLWYHLRIYMRIFRALVARERHATCLSGRADDAVGSAKVALVSIERSRAALRSLAPDRPADIAGLIALLDTLEHGLDERFPGARAFLRVGLDVPAAE